jgi:hypothetical protein
MQDAGLLARAASAVLFSKLSPWFRRGVRRGGLCPLQVLGENERE